MARICSYSTNEQCIRDITTLLLLQEKD
uniref:Uncharacterized protein n=1 Tax=Arundo donax TaxID=35708 RepID=A0A0A9CZX9_ARUDO